MVQAGEPLLAKASNAGAHVTGLTLSKEQKQFCDTTFKQKNIDSTVKLKDYRRINGLYDHIVSIEMFEAVGKKYWNTYFNKIKQCLKKNGKAVIQTILIEKPYHKKYAKHSDFIREYIFPGGFLPTAEQFKSAANQYSLKLDNEYYFGHCYAKTLRSWFDNFTRRESEIRNLGYKNEFIRMWQFYLCFCIAGFESQRTNVAQFTLINK